MRPAARPIGCTWASNDPKTVADRFLTAWTTGDFGTARSLLHDDVSFSGPIDRFDNADAYLGALKGLSQIVKAAEEQKVFVDGNDVCVIYDLVTNTPYTGRRAARPTRSGGRGTSRAARPGGRVTGLTRPLCEIGQASARERRLR